MERLDTIAAMKAFRAAARGSRRTMGFVPTMGALHEGHLSLVRAARATCDLVVASVFVNPLQFGPSEDFARYPRDLDGDAALLAEAGCDALFTTTPEAMYPPGFGTFVIADALADRLEGAIRPGHFRGMLTVVLKLFHIVQPDRAYFGHKDVQQSVLVRRMARDLDLDLDVVVCPTVRDAEGLALSSRNRYLARADRAAALAPSRALAAACRAFAAGERSPGALGDAMREVLERPGSLAIDYAVAVDPRTLLAPEAGRPLPDDAVAIIAVRIGGTRLIDNTPLASPDLPPGLLDLPVGAMRQTAASRP